MTAEARLLRVRAAIRELILWLAVIALFQAGVVQAYVVPTGSMERTILPGELVVADKLTLGPRTPQWVGVPWTKVGFHLPALKLPGFRPVRRGDIVLAEVPVDQATPYVKRVVALGGDTVELRDKRLHVNGEPVEESWAVHADRRTFPRGVAQEGLPPGMGNRDNWGPFEVPAGHVFLMGDNRDFSADSRYFGAVPERNIIGRARLVAFSVDEDLAAHAPWKAVRLGRLGTVLR